MIVSYLTLTALVVFANYRLRGERLEQALATVIYAVGMVAQLSHGGVLV